MNHFKFHIGDYAAATGHLNFLEDAAYTRLLRIYYGSEKPIPKDMRSVYRIVRAQSKPEREAVEIVLHEFFDEQDDGWHQKRCDEELAAYHDRAEINRKLGKRGGRPRKTETVSEKNPNGSSLETETVSEKNPSHKPLAISQKPEEKQNQKQGRASAPDIPDWLPDDCWEMWHKFRNSRKGWTADARTLSLRTLAKLRESGEDPRKVIEQSIERGWTGLFPVKNQNGARLEHGTTGASPASMRRLA